MTVSENTEKRLVLAERLAVTLLEQGLDRATLKSLAQALDTSDRMLLYYFEDKADLLSAALGVLVERSLNLIEAQLADGPRDHQGLTEALEAIMLSDAARPFGRIWLEIVARAGREDPIFKPVAERIAAGLFDWLRNRLTEDEKSKTLEILRRVEGAVLLDAVGIR